MGLDFCGRLCHLSNAAVLRFEMPRLGVKSVWVESTATESILCRNRLTVTVVFAMGLTLTLAYTHVTPPHM